MAKRTAIVDLGSNGVRMAIYERTSRFGFYILHEQKIKFRLTKGADKYGNIAKEQIDNLVKIFKFFLDIAANLQTRKIIAIGTSSIRDAHNQATIKKELFKNCGINIKILSGLQEAMLSGFGAINLLFEIPKAVCLDIGGGSAELSLFDNGDLIATHSLDLGTVRLKDTYEQDPKLCEILIENSVKKIPDIFKTQCLIAIGGSLRAIGGAIMALENYPLNSIHGFTYKFNNCENLIKQLYKGGELTKIKKDRHDTIRVGALVYAKIALHLNTEQVITSGAGVREGVFLKSILGRHKSLPKGFNPSLRSLEDRFAKHSSSGAFNNVKAMFECLSPLHFLKNDALLNLQMAAKAAHIGKHISFYSKHRHSAYIVRAGLNFRTTHQQKALISTIIELHGKKFDLSKLELKNLLPDEITLMWLNFILAFCRLLCFDREICKFELNDKTLHVYKNNFNHLAIERLRKIYRPKWLKIHINNIALDD